MSFASIPHCCLVGPHLVVVKDDRYISETLRGPHSLLRAAACKQDGDGHWWLQLDAPRRTLEHPVLAIGGRSTNSYFHWMTDVVPRLTAALEHRSLRELTLVMRPVKHEFQRQTLAWMGVEPLQVSEEIVTAPRVVLPSSLIHDKRNARYARDLIPLVRRFRDRYVPRAGGGKPARLYISRRDAHRRHVTNEEEVRTTLEALGFEPVELTSMPLQEQIARFGAAEAIVGQHGGGLTGLLFARPHTRVVELFPRGFPAPSPFWTIASLRDLDYEMLLCDVADPKVPEGEARKNADLRVDIDALREVLNRGPLRGAGR
jgi:capsular polysaccharide biosynthesis protein